MVRTLQHLWEMICMPNVLREKSCKWIWYWGRELATHRLDLGESLQPGHFYWMEKRPPAVPRKQNIQIFWTILSLTSGICFKDH